MTAFAPHRDTLVSFVDCFHGGADKDVLAGLLAEDVVMYSPLGGEAVTGRDAAVETIRTVNRLAVDDSYEEVLTHMSRKMLRLAGFRVLTVRKTQSCSSCRSGECLDQLGDALYGL